MRRFTVKRFNTLGDSRFHTWGVWDNQKGDYVKQRTGHSTFTADSPIKATMQELANSLNRQLA